MGQIWNADFTKTVPEGAAGNQAQKGIFFDDDRGITQRLTEAEGHEIGMNPETVERNPIGQESPSTEIRSYHMTIDKDIIIKKGEPNYEFFAQFMRHRPTGDNAKLKVYLVDFRIEEIGEKHNRYYAEAMMMTVTVNSINETDGILSVNFAQDGDYTIGVMGRTDNSTSDDDSTFTYGFTSSRQIAVTLIKTSRETVEIPVGGQARVAVSFSPLGCPYDFMIETDDKAIAVGNRWNQSVDIKGRGEGAAKITVISTADLTKKTAITVNVGNVVTPNPDPTPDPDPEPIPVTGISLNVDTLELEVDDTEQLIAAIEPSDATNKNVTWESDDTDVATVDQSGNVIAIAVGTATITVTTEDGGFEAECEVTVS